MITNDESQTKEVKKIYLLESDLPKNVITGYASHKTSFVLHIHGPCGPNEIRNIISLLEIQAHLIEEDGQ